MAIAEAAKVVFQTALAGTLEAKGFRRISDTNYAIEGDGIEWRVVFGPEFKDDPGTFREETGIYLPEIDELYQRAYPKDGPVSSPLAMTRYREHFSTHISVRYSDTESDQGNINALFSDIEPCFRLQEWSQGRREHWTTQGHDPEALGERINKYWIDYVWPWLEPGMTKADACRLQDGRILVSGFQTEFFGPWVCGHHQLVIDELKRRKDEAHTPAEDIRDMLLKRAKVSYPYFQWLFHRPKQNDVEHHMRFLQKIAKTADHLAEVLEVEL